MYIDELPDQTEHLARLHKIVAEQYPQTMIIDKRILRPGNEQRIYFPTRPTHIDVLQVHPQMVLATLVLQFPIGLIERYMPFHSLVYQIPDGLEATVLDYAQWDAMIAELHLKNDMMRLISFMLSGVLSQVGDVLTQTSRSAVRNLIHRYDRLRRVCELKDCLIDFISCRCNYSRATIYQIVKEHKKNGLIEMDGGKLIRIVGELD